MSAIQMDEPDTRGVGGVTAAARRSAGRTNDLRLAAGHVVAMRMALGVAGALDPARSDHAEFARMVPEKVQAYSATNRIMLKHSGLIAREVTRLASAETQTTARATTAMVSCANPADLATAQSTYLAALLDRTTKNLVAIAMMAFSAQDAAMGPVRPQVAANVEDLAV
jgi:hypothetical protein